jgi:hypothetical protein
VARGGGASARQQAGEELVRDAWAPAHGELMAGKAGKSSAGGAVGGRRREAEQGGEMVIRTILQFPKVPGTFL